MGLKKRKTGRDEVVFPGTQSFNQILLQRKVRGCDLISGKLQNKQQKNREGDDSS